MLHVLQKSRPLVINLLLGEYYYRLHLHTIAGFFVQYRYIEGRSITS